MNEENFIYFIEHSSIGYYSKGNNGIILLATLNENIVSPIETNKIILKIVFITNDEESEPIILSKEFDFDQKTEEEFMKEVTSQVEIYEKTINDPICPQIFYSNIYKNRGLLESIIKKTKKKDLQNIFLDYEENVDKYGIIVMEFLNYKTLYYYKNHNSFPLYQNKARYLLLRLALETGYTHSDFHIANILMNINKGKPLLIDFTWAEKIPEDKMELIKKKCIDGKYKDALLIIGNIPRRDNIDLNKYDDFNWITKDISYKIYDNHLIDKLFIH